MKRDIKGRQNRFMQQGGLKNRVIDFARKLGIRRRLIMLFVLATLIPTLVIGIVVYRVTGATLYKNMNQTIASINDQAATYISKRMRNIISDSVEISKLDLIQNLLRNYEGYDYIDIYKMTKEFVRLMSSEFVFNDSLADMSLYTPDLQRISLFGPYTYRFKPTKQELMSLTEQADKGEDILFSVNANNSIILFRQIKDKETGEKLGYLSMRIDENRISELYLDTFSGFHGETVILNQEGTVVSSSDSSDLAKQFDDGSLLESLKHAQADRAEFVFIWEGKKQIVNHSGITGTNWNIVTLVPATFFRVDSRQLMLILIIVLAVCLAFSMIISLLVAFSILKPVNQIVYAMKNYENDKSDVLLQQEGNDELTFMTETFNKMSLRLNQQMQDIRSAEKQKRHLELQALQAQINPHFIANTLNLISNIASANQMDSIETISKSLVNLVRDCCRNDEYYVTVEEEVSMLQSYIDIQDYRTMGRFSVRLQIEPSILKYMVPHLILQPIVENAILHGVLSEKGQRGLISIHGHKDQGMLLFSVTDNGKGMSKDQIREVLDRETENHERGRLNSIGIQNIQQRIQLLFGEPYGISIFSEPGVYTTVNISLPMITEQELMQHV